jgi:hypothetical protein
MILELPFERFTVVSSLRESMFIMDLLTSACAFGLGWIVYYRWRPAAAKLVWAIGLCWFGQRALFPPDGNHVVLWEVFATRFGSPDWAAMGNWTLYTVLPLRLMFYSAGAFACSHKAGMGARAPEPFR